ncbi:MAG: gliding motility-associated C-terminal domain-containing protein [Bacteroidota bacterium]|nr:gliding motility-associated C-terminal domain-containing protein [Bacteroidota bacterium]
MIRIRPIITLFFTFAAILASIAPFRQVSAHVPQTAHRSRIGQTPPSARGIDTISVSSTCVNSVISFYSPVFDSLPFPTSVYWNFGDPASGIYNTAATRQPRHSFAATGAYPILLRVINNGTDTILIHDTIRIVSPMAYNFGPDIFLCQGQDTLLTAPAAPGATFAWNDPDTTRTDTLRVTKSGLYTVSIDGCQVADSIGVYISETPKIDLGKDHILCDGENLELNAATQNGQYAWFLNGAVLPFQQAQLPVQSPGGTYVAVVTVPGCGVYKDTVSITFTQPNAPSFSLGPDTLLCPKQAYVLDANPNGNHAGTAYDWSTGATGSSITVTSPGLYWVFATIGGQCQVVDTVQVNYRGDKQLDFHDTAICQGSTLSLDADFGVGTYNWSAIPPQRDDQNQTGQSTYFVYRPGTYSITATVGQCVYKDTLTVSFNDSLKVSMAGDTNLCNGEDYWLRVNGNANTYAWQDSLTTGDTYHVTVPGFYRVVAQNGCNKDTLSAIVNFTACSCNLLLPNAFTPEGAGNNHFRALHACRMSEYQLLIYDRYGELVFETKDPETGWDGNFRGARMPAGPYIWSVHYINTDTKQKVFRRGTVLLLR